MDLRDLDIGISYITFGEPNLRDDLIIPALKVAVQYRRSVGYFSSKALESIFDGVMALVENGGKIQIVTSPQLSTQDQEAISLGYSLREEIIKNAFLRDWENALNDLPDDKLQLMAALIAEEVLDIRVTDINEENDCVVTEGNYHDKLGIITDSYGNSVVYVGSSNETANGLAHNYEKVRVFKSWEFGQSEYAQDEIMEFNRLWEGRNEFLKTYQFKDALNEKIIKVQNDKKKKKNQTPVKLRDYQEEAVQAWVDNNYHGFYVMATGTGKTWTAIFAVQEYLKEHPAMLVVIAPYKHLLKQWEQDIKSMMPEAVTILVSSENPKWPAEMANAIVRQRHQMDTQIIVISTISSFGLERFNTQMQKSTQKKVLIVDEAHRFTKRPDTIPTEYSAMLGLSATPFNGKNIEKGNELVKFFGGKVYDLPIEKALARNFLTHYNYYPIFVSSTQDEEAQFDAISSQMAACFINNICIDPEKLALLSKKRLRVIAMSEEKNSRLDWILDHIHEKDHFIVYCGDGKLYQDDQDAGIRHINFVKKILNNRKVVVSQFTADENMKERMDLIKLFNTGALDCLAAIRCLDEGIDIPSIKGALLLASNDDFREFTQRRGRILRLFPGKETANIYDVIVLPTWSMQKWAEIELRRFNEYAKLAENYSELQPILKDYLYEYGLSEDQIKFRFDDTSEQLEEVLDD